MHVLMNFIYGLTHQKLIHHEGGAVYRQLIIKYNCWNTISIVVSFLTTFKFHILQMSYFWNSTALSGEWPKEVWGVWNMVVIMYVISCYSVLIGSAGYFVLNNMNLMDQWIFWASCDVAALSTYMAVLMLISACCQGNKKSHKDID